MDDIFEINFSVIDKIKKSIKEDEKKSKILNYSLIFIGVLFLIFGIMEFLSQSEKIADNVLFGETAAYGVILFILGLIIIAGTLFMRFSFNTPLNETFDDIKNFESKKQSSNKKEDKTDENEDEETTTDDNENKENKTINTISENLKNRSKKVKDKKIISKNIKSVLNYDKIKNIDNPLPSNKKEKIDEKINNKNKNSKKNNKNHKNKTTNSSSVSFDDAMESVDDLLDD